LKQFGIKQEEIDANRVIIECDDHNIVIDNPNVSSIIMKGQKMFQIIGEPKIVKKAVKEENGKKDEEKEEEKTEEPTEEDIKIVMEKTNCSYDEAKQKLSETKDIAKAILELTSDKQ